MIFTLLTLTGAWGATWWNMSTTCSGRLADPQLLVVYEARQDRGGRYFALQPPAHPERVRLDGNFVLMDLVSDLVRPISAEPDDNVERVAGKAVREWTARQRDLLFTVNFGIMRGPVLGVNPDVPTGRELEFDRLLLRPMERIYRTIAERFRRQGPERAELVPLLTTQDRAELSRVTRFSLSRFSKSMAYAQVLVSRDPSEKLHLSAAWGDQVEDLLRTRPDEVVGEFGRLVVEHPNQGWEAFAEEEITAIDDPFGHRATSAIILRLLFQKVLAWVNSDARLDRLLFQVKLGLEKRLLTAGVPLWLGQRRELTKRWSGGRDVTEVAYAFDRAALLAGEDLLLARVMLDWFEYVQRQPHFQLAPRGQLQVFIYPNEAASLRRLGFYQTMFQRDLPLEAFGDWETSFILGLHQIPEASRYLAAKAGVTPRSDIQENKAGAVGREAHAAKPFVTQPKARE